MGGVGMLIYCYREEIGWRGDLHTRRVEMYQGMAKSTDYTPKYLTISILIFSGWSKLTLS